MPIWRRPSDALKAVFLYWLCVITAFSLGTTTLNSAMVGASFMGSFGIDAVIFKTLEPRDRERRHGAVAGMDDSP